MWGCTLILLNFAFLSSDLGLSGVNNKSLIDLFTDSHLFCQALNQMVKTQEWKNMSLPLRWLHSIEEADEAIQRGISETSETADEGPPPVFEN